MNKHSNKMQINTLQVITAARTKHVDLFGASRTTTSRHRLKGACTFVHMGKSSSGRSSPACAKGQLVRHGKVSPKDSVTHEAKLISKLYVKIVRGTDQ